MLQHRNNPQSISWIGASVNKIKCTDSVLFTENWMELTSAVKQIFACMTWVSTGFRSNCEWRVVDSQLNVWARMTGHLCPWHRWWRGWQYAAWWCHIVTIVWISHPQSQIWHQVSGNSDSEDHFNCRLFVSIELKFQTWQTSDFRIEAGGRGTGTEHRSQYWQELGLWW